MANKQAPSQAVPPERASSGAGPVPADPQLPAEQDLPQKPQEWQPQPTPQISPDGRWWWNGNRWVPIPEPKPPSVGAHPPAPPPSVVGPVPKPRRRRWWIIAAILTACVVGAGVGLNAAMHTIDTYTADLTKGSGDFRTGNNASIALFYRADGYHMVAKSPGFVMAGVTAVGSHTVVAAKVTVRAMTAPPGAAFGPLVLANSNGAGYWLSVDSAGTATLAEIDARGDVWAITSAKAPPLGTGTTRTLMLTCVINPGGTVRLAGYVNGTRVISGAPTVKISSVAATGMAGHAKTSVPAEWVVTRFTRLGPDDMPKD